MSDAQFAGVPIIWNAADHYFDLGPAFCKIGRLLVGWGLRATLRGNERPPSKGWRSKSAIDRSTSFGRRIRLYRRIRLRPQNASTAAPPSTAVSDRPQNPPQQSAGHSSPDGDAP